MLILKYCPTFKEILFAANFLGAIGFCASSQAAEIYSNDFEVNADGFTSSSGISFSNLPTDDLGFGSPNQSRYLGNYANDSLTLTLTGLTPGTIYNVAFDLFIGASWDGNSTSAGPDNWSLTTGSPVSGTLVSTTFSNLLPSDQPLPAICVALLAQKALFNAQITAIEQALPAVLPPAQRAAIIAQLEATRAQGNAQLDATLAAAGCIPADFSQSYSDLTPVGPGTFPPFTGADVAQPNGGVLNRYGIYYFGHGAGNPELSFTAIGDSETLTFSGSNLESPTNEFWALDNVVISTPTTGETVPESSEGLALIAFAAVSVLRHYWKRLPDAA